MEKNRNILKIGKKKEGRDWALKAIGVVVKLGGGEVASNGGVEEEWEWEGRWGKKLLLALKN